VHAQTMKALIHVPCDLEPENDVRLLMSGKEFSREQREMLPAGLDSYFSFKPELPVRIDTQADPTLPAALPLLCVPIGLALKGLKPLPYDVNFVPPRQRARKRRSKRKIGAAVAAVAMLLLSIAGMANSIFKLNMRHMVLKEQVHELQKEFSSIEQLQGEAEKIEQFTGLIQEIRTREISKLKLLNELTNIIPKDIWLTEINITASKRLVKLSGFAVSAAQLIPTLEASTLFEKVKFTSPITKDKVNDRERFRLEMRLVTNKEKTS
ncbi:MAG: PilN domain-containing protein, partial [Deltaproteobacteria bacterium]|nr:PilN domain-containing protein [Deltaproteobacteria bacterium]